MVVVIDEQHNLCKTSGFGGKTFTWFELSNFFSNSSYNLITKRKHTNYYSYCSRE